MKFASDVLSPVARGAVGALVVVMLGGAGADFQAVLQATGAAQSGSPVESQILRASNAWFDALARRDVDALDRMTTDDFLAIQQAPTGVAVVTKDAQLDNLRKNSAPATPLQRALSAIRVREYGATAILTALASFTGQNASGQTFRSGAMIAEVWIREGAGWRLTHFQTTDVPLQPGQ